MSSSSDSRTKFQFEVCTACDAATQDPYYITNAPSIEPAFVLCKACFEKERAKWTSSTKR